MMRRLRNVLAVSIVLTTLLAPTTAQAVDVFNNACSGGGASSAVCQGRTTKSPLVGPDGLLIKVSRVIAVLAGVAAVIMVLISGLQYISSGGDPGKAEAAKSTLTYAIVGIVVIVLAESIVSFVLVRL